MLSPRQLHEAETRCSTPNEFLSLVHVRTPATINDHLGRRYRQHGVNGCIHSSQGLSPRVHARVELCSLLLMRSSWISFFVSAATITSKRSVSWPLQRFSRSADRPAADPRTAAVSMRHS